jgi:hypothetical protein
LQTVNHECTNNDGGDNVTWYTQGKKGDERRTRYTVVSSL